MIDIPVPFVAATYSFVLIVALALATWSIRTVRGAALVVSANAALKSTVEAQRGCIESLEREVADLTKQLATAKEHIVELERIVKDLDVRLHIREQHNGDQRRRENA